jgi:alpha-L-arabinofuranosidase
MTGLLRNADVVRMAAYAPLFAKEGSTQWRPDLIWFDNTRVYGSPSYHVQALFSRNRPDIVLPVSVTQPAPRTASGRVGVGTWNTRAEYRDLKVVSADGGTLFESDFSAGLEGWKTAGGDWKVVDGALRQNAIEENVRAVVGDPSWTDYTLTLKARKIDGREGFLVLFETSDIDSPVWWNIGGWANTQHGLEGGGMPERRVRGSIESGRWYDVEIESCATCVKAYLDGKLVQEGKRKPITTLFAVAGRSGTELILKVVNTAPQPQETSIQIEGVTRLASRAQATVLSGDPEDQNTLNAPDNLVPVTGEIEIPGPEMTRTFPGNSLTVIRMKVFE